MSDSSLDPSREVDDLIPKFRIIVEERQTDGEWAEITAERCEFSGLVDFDWQRSPIRAIRAKCLGRNLFHGKSTVNLGEKK